MKRSLLACWFLLMTLMMCGQGFETAADAVNHMRVGWNLGNTLDAHDGHPCPDIVRSETMWGQPVTKPELMAMMKEAGFGAIRIPVTWYPHMDSDGKVDAAWMKRVHEVVDYVISQGLYCLLNVHHDTGDGPQWLHASMSVYNEQKHRYEYLWRQIAEEFKDYDEHLLFESYNEMLDKYNSWCFAAFNRSGGYNAADATDAYQAINAYAQSFVNAVRSTGGNNLERNLVVNTYGACSGAGNWNLHLKDPLKQMALPTDLSAGHLIFQVHAYHHVKNLNSAKAEVDEMFKALKTHLAVKGAPVIIGEWGTANDGESDYMVRRSNVLAFADYFVRQANEYRFGTFWWMGISDGMMRSLPAFTQPDVAAAILHAYYGSDYQPLLLTKDDYDLTYTVHYSAQWQELYLCNFSFRLSDFKGVRVELDEAPANGFLAIKVYGESDGKEQYRTLGTTTSATLSFNAAVLGSSTRGITLQYTLSTPYSIKVKRAVLIRHDGSELETDLSVFWGCTLDINSVKKSTGFAIPMAQSRSATADCLYDLQGCSVRHPQKGVYISKGRKYVVK